MVPYLFRFFLLLSMYFLTYADDGCNFENVDECSWYFSNSHDLERILKAQRSSPTAVIPQRTLSSGSDDASKHGKDSNFYVVVSGGRNVSNHYAYFLSKKHSDDAAMIVSPFYEYTSPKCELLLRHRVLGEPGAELLVTTEQLTLSVLAHLPSFRNAHLPPANEAEDDDWIRPTLRARFQPEEGNEPWTTSRVAIGTFHYPTRIRLECHASGEDRPGVDLNVECHVDDLQLINCEEELHESTKCVDTKSERKYSCRAGGKQLCLKYDDLCDFHAECEHDEDESEDLHRCSLVPAGARCNFEELSLSAGCPNWRFFSGFSNTSTSNEKTHLVTLTTSDRRLQRGQAMARPGMPPSEYHYRGRLYRPGHFLFFSSYDHTTSSEHEIVYTYAVSPYFPPLSAPSYQKSSVSAGNCVVRFFYCRTGSSPFQVFLVSKDQPHESKPLWSPPKEEHTMDPCEWKRASAVIRPSSEIKMRHEYYLKLSFAKIAGSLGSIAIDDFSLTPNCFINLPPWKSRIFPSIFNASTCGFTGSEAPKVDICSELQPENAEQQKFPGNSEMSPLFTGNNKWIVSETTVYRVELYAASGGLLPSQSVNNRGGAIVANIRLNASDELSFIIGQQGQSPCDSGLPKLTSKMRSLRDIICSKRPKISDIEASGRDVSSIVGTGGGGATVLFINSRPAIVVGGGAGTFLELFESGSGHQHTIEGGLLDESSAKLNMSLPSVEWISGVGASLNPKPKLTENASQFCADCDMMNGHLVNNTRLYAGVCPRNRLWNITGGYGGGGASCGPGGGGGGGFTGGAGGHKAQGEGGTSAFLLPESDRFVWKSGFNPGSGRVIVRACPQQFCPVNSTCEFSPPSFDEPSEMFCVCLEGNEHVPLNGTCPDYSNPLLFRLASRYLPFLILTLNILLFLLLFFLCYMCRGCLSANRRKKRCMDGHELLSIEGESSRCIGNKIIGNPIYETLQLAEYTHIPRNALQLDRIIGHGAFGEVYEGYYLNGPNQRTKVAIKSLPMESCSEILDDFETEAKLLSQFKHENIVTFYGVSFDQQPKYIVLEYLEGGDLKNFLRESRPKFSPTGTPVFQDHNLRMTDLVAMSLDVAKGAAHLEATKFVHRDLAARNCLLTSKRPGRVVKIADFGMARDIYRMNYYRKGGKAFLPVRWMPPEAFLDGIFTTKTDVWAFGVLLWEIFSMGYVPYSGRENHEVMKLVVAGDRLDPPIGILTEIYDVMLLCWNTEAEKRPTFMDLVDFFSTLLKRDDVVNEPLPQIRYRTLRDRLSATPSTTKTQDSVPLGEVDLANPPSSTISQATASTVITEGTSSTSYDSMPTTGDGICRNVFPPYQAKVANTLMKLEPSKHSMMEQQASVDGESPSSKSSGTDDSTLHGSAASTVRYQVRPTKMSTDDPPNKYWRNEDYPAPLSASAVAPPWRTETQPESERGSLPPLPPSANGTPPDRRKPPTPSPRWNSAARHFSFTISSQSPPPIDLSPSEEDRGSTKTEPSPKDKRKRPGIMLTTPQRQSSPLV